MEELTKKMEEKVEIFKALSDANRLVILELLSCGEMCACDIMDNLDLSQPTISHHMKILQQSGLINKEKRGKWMFYSINKDKVDSLCDFIKYSTSYKEDCICKKIKKNNCCDEE
ncbi:transcriptional regulator, ArsR family [Gottschalkia purinilytica]|uniref:Transcriptional regulator, ArsR family n=1 Tax=Gottschalkia purinilytica TaxID=1503 RepID=A0A0L0W7M8_GOTPU|nr:metalloregulator ArsR/SmtB family transcription factor [Gottschalkia purinilytica]KNF07305.1 transcriptional regulator, ArsR family [Gottschalkia purinilytica]